MARLEFEGIDELSQALERCKNIPWDEKSRALTSMGQVAAAKIKASGEAMGVRDRESSAHILDKIKVQKPKETKDGGYVNITFSGSRTRGRTRTSNSAIAFENEFGNRHQSDRPFVGKAMSQNEGAILEPGIEILGDWIEKEFEK